ncbi:PEGA domain-containing protein, partial [candidate division KSB1 bacterium]|nr:PEGA domain-containing protein [candidate division KSB1 bacterium]
DDEEEGEDDIKTVIDVIRLSAKTHKKPLIIGSVGSLAAIIIFMVLNIAFRWTSFGEQIYDYLFPPAIKINSVPPGANVYIDDKKAPGKTPLNIAKISPGIHKLKLTYAGFPDLTRSLTVPGSGEIQIDGEKSRKGYEPYLFRFKTKIELNSDPIDATVYINNIKYKQRTPTILEWEVGKPLNIEMSKPGFQDLTGFTLDTQAEAVDIEDHRLWNFKIVDGETRRYIIEGLFKKFISVSSLPNGATFYLDGSPTPTGKTGSSQTIALSVGDHSVLFTRAGFNSKRVRVTVDENGPKTIFVSLTRNVRFFAKDVTVPNDNDINATISRIYRQGRSYSRKDKTPCEIALPLVNHKVLIKKEGYKDAVVLVSPKSKVIVARMEPENSSLEVEVTDALTGQPVENAQVSYYSMNSRLRNETYFGSTNNRGWCRNKLEPGQYTFVVKKSGYFEKSANINTLTGTKKLEFKLIVQ